MDDNSSNELDIEEMPAEEKHMTLMNHARDRFERHQRNRDAFYDEIQTQRESGHDHNTNWGRINARAQPRHVRPKYTAVKEKEFRKHQRRDREYYER